MPGFPAMLLAIEQEQCLQADGMLAKQRGMHGKL